MIGGREGFEGKRTELFGRVYEWSFVDGRWTLELVWTDEQMALVLELNKALASGDRDELVAILERLNDTGNYEFGEAPR